MKLIFSKLQKTPATANRKKLITLIKRAIELILPEYCTPEHSESELHVLLVGETQMTELNETYLGHEGVTDVIAFDMRSDLPGIPDEEEVVGEIYVCLPVAEKAALQYSTRFAFETMLYIVHGLLHLSGKDDHSPEDRADMRKAETSVMSVLEKECDLTQLFRVS